MKKTFILLCLCCLMTSAWPQDIPKRANTIISEKPDSISFSQTSKLLIENGYGIKHSDKDLGVITTEPKAVKRAGDLSLIISIEKNKATIRGSYKGAAVNYYGLIDDTWSAVENRGMKGSPSWMAWDEMHKIASLIGDSLSYKVIK